MSISFFCGPTSRLETWATLLCRLYCLSEDKSVGILYAHFSHRPSLVEATHPRDQHDWTATVHHQCLHVASEHISAVPSACSSCKSIILVTRLTHWHLQRNEPIWRLNKTDSLKKEKPSMSKEMRTVDGCRSRQLRAQPLMAVIFHFLPSCVCIRLDQVAKLLDASAEWRVFCAFQDGKVRQGYGQERDVEVSVQERDRRVKHEKGEGEIEINDTQATKHLFHEHEPCVYVHAHENVRMCAGKLCNRKKCACNK